jgi:uncharacterized membrane protein
MLDPYLVEWLGLVGRWFHLTLGIAWIGASFYFVWLNNAVRPPVPGEAPPGVAGTVWSVHGGAFYCVQKYGGVPEKLPHELHWFKWEAYLTWLSGFYLLVLLYWTAPTATLLPAGSALGPWAAVGLSAAVLLLGWLLYDLACRVLGARPVLLVAVLAVFVAAADYGLHQVMTPRAAYLHVGAMLGTWMAANVFRVIIPGQRAMVDALLAGREPPVERGAAGAQRSLHNNYLTLPVLFVMLSGHFPSTWGHPLGWVVLLGIAAAGALARHAINVAERGQPMPWLWPLAAALLAGFALLARPTPAPQAASGEAVPFTQVQMVVAARCLPCHAERPILGGYATAPKGVQLDTPESIERHRDAILTQVVRTKVMPLGNLTQMTEEERALIGAWAER